MLSRLLSDRVNIERIRFRIPDKTNDAGDKKNDTDSACDCLADPAQDTVGLNLIVDVVF